VLQRAAKRVHEQLRLRDENFVDTSGTVRLHLPGILVDRTDLKPPTVRGAPEVRNPYSDKNSLLARSLLTSSSHTWLSLQELAGIVGIPLSSASYVIKALERSGFVGTKRTSSGLEVTLLDPLGLIEDWARQYDWTRNPAVTFAAPVGSPERFLDRLKKAMKEHRWALTLQGGASLLAPHAIWDHVHFYMDTGSRSGLLEMGKSLGWEPSPTGKVTVMLPYYRKSLWGGVRQVKGKPVVSTLQLVLDLWHYPVRGREQAEHLLDVVGLGAS
jgi:hypothetical protein